LGDNYLCPASLKTVVQVLEAHCEFGSLTLWSSVALYLRV